MTAVVNVISNIREERGYVCRVNPILWLIRVIVVDIFWQAPCTDKIFVAAVIVLEFHEHIVIRDQLSESLNAVDYDFVGIQAVAFIAPAIGAEGCDCNVHCDESLPFPL